MPVPPRLSLLLQSPVRWKRHASTFAQTIGTTATTSCNTSKRRAWIVTAGKPGNDRQAIALAKGLGCTIEMKHIVPHSSIKWLFPVFQKHFLDYRSQTFGPHSAPTDLPFYLTSPKHDTLAPPYPDLILSTCAETTLASLHLKKTTQTPAVHIGLPFVSVEEFNVVVVWKYAWPVLGMRRDERVVGVDVLLGEVLEGEESEECVLGVLVSGVRGREFGWGVEDGSRFVRRLERLLRHANPPRILLVTCQSTPQALVQTLQKWYTSLPPSKASQITLLPSTKHDHVLRHATHFAVFGDDVATLSECLGYKKPVYVIGMQNCRGALRRFYGDLVAKARVRVFVPAAHAGDGDVFSDVGEHPEWRFEGGCLEGVVAEVGRRLWGDGWR
ncbi:uncharacterized protein SPPG_03420 [Spizellomyces punctatus DAOM BR117]|uniref:Uncharacterized protein n=1 Tax=Spizellomyces punctatus (strain DAOM BR117) TaxID=645134 RepID=A0A0L0HL63_SPIPD|nr:uncharacterized protein SPPG_03420 [Spizellomyces punctatus DAOM BR117]KND01625.1 hypothetical protein SPPG_03420 [Spizellomyces punctatus DAOM BR117]|eukprot:XP_016609664.1 hypothetical protein SPPG_03420 [Spizellomyces punctatus DAOM BR117]